MYYYDFIMSNLNKPLYFVFGNHHLDDYSHYDKKHGVDADPFQTQAAQFKNTGAAYIECKIAKQTNMLLLGLGGCMRYNKGKNQFTEYGMLLKIITILPALVYNRLRYGRFLDILITHAPPYNIHDLQDVCHQGFRVFRWFMKIFKPKYLIHGHVHLYENTKNRVTRYRDTQVINAYDHFILEIPDWN